MVVEIESSFRVYVRQWLIESRHAVQSQAESFLKENFEGRLRPDDAKVNISSDGSFVVCSRRWNLNSEWKTQELADVWAKSLRDISPNSDCEVVSRNSKAEHSLINYGKVMLPS